MVLKSAKTPSPPSNPFAAKPKPLSLMSHTFWRPTARDAFKALCGWTWLIETHSTWPDDMKPLGEQVAQSGSNVREIAPNWWTRIVGKHS